MSKINVNDPSAKMFGARTLDGDLFANKFNDGWLVGRAIEVELIHKRDANWPAIASLAAAGPLRNDGATAGAVPDKPTLLAAEATGKTFLYTDEEDVMVQIFATVNVPLLRVFCEIPHGVRQGAMPRSDIGVPTLTAAAINTWGWQWTGYQSPPGDARRVSMIMVPYKTEVGYAAFNEAGSAFQPIFDWYLNKIRFEALDPTDKSDAKVIEMVLKNRIERAIKWSPGFNGQNFQFGFKKIFGVEPVIQKANKLYAGTEAEANVIAGGD